MDGPDIQGGDDRRKNNAVRAEQRPRPAVRRTGPLCGGRRTVPKGVANPGRASYNRVARGAVLPRKLKRQRRKRLWNRWTKYGIARQTTGSDTTGGRRALRACFLTLFFGAQSGLCALHARICVFWFCLPRRRASGACFRGFFVRAGTPCSSSDTQEEGGNTNGSAV